MFSQIVIIAVLFAVSLALLALEVFLIPGFGVAGVAGFLFLAGAVITSFYFFGTLYGTVVLFGAIFIIMIGTIITIRSKTSKKMILNDDIPKTKNDLSHLVGKEGLAITLLRPSGAIEIDNNRYDVVTEGEYIAKGEKIKVVDFKDGHLIVEKTGG